MLDHVFITVSDFERSIAFYTKALEPLGITKRLDYDGRLDIRTSRASVRMAG